ncbi:transglycosylase domain-containing protein [soil metagenome]
MADSPKNKVPKKNSKNRNVLGTVIKVMWITFITGIILLSLFVYSVSTNFMNLYGELPDTRTLENPKNDEASELFSADNVSLGKYFRENRSPVEYEEISPNFLNTLIASEDYRFEEHSGIDLKGLVRAAVFSVALGSKQGGGSTLTHQLAKNLFKIRSKNSEGTLSNVPGLGMVIIKTKESIMAARLERSYTKKEIIKMYLNTVEYGSNSYGLKVAAKTFFNTTPDSLNLQQSALLVGLLQNPSFYNPVRNPNNAFNKRNQVLGKLERYNMITAAQLDSLRALPIELKYEVENHNKGLATYFRSFIRGPLHKWAEENGYDLYQSGLKIYTTIDSRMQRYAEEAMQEHMTYLQEKFEEHWKGKNPWIDEDGQEIKDFVKLAARRSPYYRELQKIYGKDSDSVMIMMNKPQKMRIFTWDGEKDTVMSQMDSIRHFKRFLQAGFMSMEPQTGHVKAWVGGINHKYFKYDHVKQGRRQPGSTFKPFVYAAAIDNGYSPCYEVVDSKVTYHLEGSDPPTWTPPNFDHTYTNEKMTLRQALAKSINTVTAFMMKKIGPENVVNMARSLGVKSPLDPVLALSLGTSDVSVYEMVGAYSTFVNEGIYTEPMYITRIEDKNGNVIQEFPPRTVEALNEETAYLMLYMLRGATEAGGTAVGLSYDLRVDNEIAAKTGTTNNYSDGWFMGLTKNLVSGVWVGGDERSIHFRTSTHGVGGRMAMPIWDKYMKKVYADATLGYDKGSFKNPTQPLSIEIDCERYKNDNFYEIEADTLDYDFDRKNVSKEDIF